MFTPAFTIPYEIPMRSRIVVLPDVHRDLHKAISVLRLCNVIDESWNWMCYDTILVQLGDQIDGWKRDGQPTEHIHGRSSQLDIEVLMFFNKLSMQSKYYNSECISIIGNHEIMNVSGYLSYADLGGCPMCTQERYALFSPGSQLCKELATSRTCFLKIGDYLFCHAGLTPKHLDAFNGNPDVYNDIMRRFLMGSESGVDRNLENILIGTEGVLSHRHYNPQIITNSTLADINYVLSKTGTKHMIIGHNTTPGNIPVYGVNKELIVFDPGVSEAVSNQRPMALEITRDNISAYRV